MSMTGIKKPLLSIVATSRNDNHGGNALWRTQHFVNGLAAQALEFEFPIELILVDWNPPSDRKGLFEALDWSKANPYFTYRVIEVPNEYHSKFNYADKLPLFQYIAKNVGIRRATANYVLSTNIDILFSNKLMSFFKRGLKPGYLYRVDRYDVDLKEDVSPFQDFQAVLEKAEQNIVRANMKFGTIPYHVLIRNNFIYKTKLYILLSSILFSVRRILGYFWRMLKYIPRGFKKLLFDPLNAYKYIIPLGREFSQDGRKFLAYLKNVYALLFSPTKVLHTNACGDFTLLSKRDWEKLKGYPEWELYSWHIDSVLIYQAFNNSIKMNNLDTTCAIFHIEHGQGSGWTPEGAKLLFDRLDKQGIAYMSDNDLAEEFEKQRKLKAKKQLVVYNDDNWGGAGVHFAEKGTLEKA